MFLPCFDLLSVALLMSFPRFNCSLDKLLDAGCIDHDLRPGASQQRERGYALTSEARSTDLHGAGA